MFIDFLLHNSYNPLNSGNTTVGDTSMIGDYDNNEFNDVNSVIKSKAQRIDLYNMNDMNISLYEEEIESLKSAVVINILLILLTMFLGAAIMCPLEGWSFSSSVYWVSIRDDILD